MRINDLIAGVLLIAVSLYLYNVSTAFPGEAGRLPQVLLGFIILLSIILIIAALRPVPGAAMESPMKDVSWPKLLGSIGLAVAYIALINTLGYYLLTPLYLLATMIILGTRKVSTLVGVSVGFTIVVYAIFSYFLRVPVPMGTFFA